ncbi:MAG: ElyC/SanA/YdcF family protein [Patescibacteria group bacterium]
MKFNRITKIILGTTATALVAALGIIAYVQLSVLNLIDQPLKNVPPGTVIMVLGASVKDDQTPSSALEDRLDTGLQLHGSNPQTKILVTGDDGAYRRDEISVMKNYLVERGLSEANLLADPKGYRTYESCKNAKAAGYTEAVIVTQRFHLARALYLCTRLGVDAIGVTADKHIYERQEYFWARDLLASFLAWLDVNIWSPRSPA